MKKIVFILILISSFFIACKNDVTTIPVKFSKQTIKKNANQDSTNTLDIELEYLVAEGENKVLVNGINDTIQSYLTYSMNTLSVDSIVAGQKDLNKAAEQFSKSYYQQVSENATLPIADRYPVRMDYQSSMVELGRNNKVTCVSLGENYYTGGAHPNMVGTYFTFDNKTGKTINLKSIMKNQNGFSDILEANLIKTKELNAKESLESQGYYLDETTKRLILPESFALSKDGKNLEIYYSPYEIACYAMGDTFISIPLDELKNVLDLDKIR